MDKKAEALGYAASLYNFERFGHEKTRKSLEAKRICPLPALVQNWTVR